MGGGGERCDRVRMWRGDPISWKGRERGWKGGHEICLRSRDPLIRVLQRRSRGRSGRWAVWRSLLHLFRGTCNQNDTSSHATVCK